MLEALDLSFRWPESEAWVLRNLSLRIAEGEKVVLLGANGCGKSTLLRLLNGLLFAESGEVRWHGRRLEREAFREREFARDFRRRNTLLFQHPEAMLFNPTVREEIAYGPRQLGLDDTDARVERWAAELKLSGQLHLPPFALSGGQKQKLALACLLVLDPALLLLDEPSAALDPRTTGWLIDTLLDSDKTLLISTHNLSLAGELGDRALVMNEQGELIFDGPLAEALGDLRLLEAAGLAHRHRHRHHGVSHAHLHVHDWEAGPTTA